MKFHQITYVCAALAMVLATPMASHAQGERPVPSRVQVQQPIGLTRAEVLADLQVWRASGLAGFDVDPSQASFGSREYAAARGRYDRMRSSAEFAALVRDIAIRRGEAEPQRVVGATDRSRN